MYQLLLLIIFYICLTPVIDLVKSFRQCILLLKRLFINKSFLFKCLCYLDNSLEYSIITWKYFRVSTSTTYFIIDGVISWPRRLCADKPYTTSEGSSFLRPSLIFSMFLALSVKTLVTTCFTFNIILLY